MADDKVTVTRFATIGEAHKHMKGIANDAEHLRALWPWPFGDEDHHPDVDHHDDGGFVETETRSCKPNGEGTFGRGEQTRSVWIDSKGRRDAGAWGPCVSTTTGES